MFERKNRQVVSNSALISDEKKGGRKFDNWRYLRAFPSILKKKNSTEFGVIDLFISIRWLLQ